jgi:hypothetical protein
MIYRPRHKFNAIPTTIDNQKFPSKLEAAYYQHLQLLKKTGDVVFFLRQVPFHLACGTKYVCDYQIFNADGTVDFVDPKGTITQEFSLKKRMVEHEYPVNIRVVQKGDF